MQFSRKQYRGRPTKWLYLNRFFDIRRAIWPPIRERQLALFISGRISVQAFKFDYNLECCTGWKWIQAQVNRAHTKEDPLQSIGQINIYRLEQCIDEIEAFLKKVETFMSEQAALPLEETEGYSYNQHWGISPTELEAMVAED